MAPKAIQGKTATGRRTRISVEVLAFGLLIVRPEPSPLSTCASCLRICRGRCGELKCGCRSYLQLGTVPLLYFRIPASELPTPNDRQELKLELQQQLLEQADAGTAASSRRQGTTGGKHSASKDNNHRRSTGRRSNPHRDSVEEDEESEEERKALEYLYNEYDTLPSLDVEKERSGRHWGRVSYQACVPPTASSLHSES